jgi:glycerate kinase
MWLLAGAPQDPDDDTVLEKHGAEALYSAVKSVMHAIQTQNEQAQQNAEHWTKQIAKHWMFKRWFESKLDN